MNTLCTRLNLVVFWDIFHIGVSLSTLCTRLNLVVSVVVTRDYFAELSSLVNLHPRQHYHRIGYPPQPLRHFPYVLVFVQNLVSIFSQLLCLACYILVHELTC
jgi:hypothetical protein